MTILLRWTSTTTFIKSTHTARLWVLFIHCQSPTQNVAGPQFSTASLRRRSRMVIVLNTSDDTLVPITKENLTRHYQRVSERNYVCQPTSSRNEVVRLPAPSSSIIFVFSMGLGSSFGWFVWPRLVLTEGELLAWSTKSK